MQGASPNVVMMLGFVPDTPPAYMKGAARAEMIERRAWYEADYIDYSGRTGKYADKATSSEEKYLAENVHGNYLDYVSRQGTFQSKGEKGMGSVGTGVFDRDGVVEGEKLKRMKKELRDTKSILWYGIISPAREVGEHMLYNKEKAMEFMQANFDRFISRTHLNPKNVDWYAGWHDDSASGIKHIQFCFWEKKPHLDSRGKQSFTRRGAVSKTALADTLVQFEEYISEKQNEVHVVRDELRKKLKAVEPKDLKKDLFKELIALGRDLPPVRGRAGYNSPEYAPYRARIDALTERVLIEVPSVRNSYAAVRAKVDEREARQQATAAYMKNMKPTDTIEPLRQDIHARIANSVIGLARTFARGERNDEWAVIHAENAKKRQAAKARAERYARQRRNNERRKNYRNFARLFDSFLAGAANDVLLYYDELERIKSGQTVEHSAGAEVAAEQKQ